LGLSALDTIEIAEFGLRTCPPLAASRRLSRSNSKKHCFVVRDHNGQQLAYVYFEDQARKMVACR
jgi:hypothetical protein